MGSDLAESLRGAEAVLNRFNNPNPTFITDTVTPICGRFPYCGQCGTCTGETRWPNKKASTDILRLRSTQPIKEKLHSIGEGIVCCIDGLQEALTLLSSISYNSAFITTLKGHNEEPRSNMKGQKMGRRTQ
jgi:hypothetical protein